MARQSVETSLAPEILIESVSGDLSVRGWDTPQVAAGGDVEGLEMQAQEDRVTLSCSGDLDVRLPAGAALTIENVAGDASLKLLEDGLVIGTISGDADLRSVSSVKIERVHGDLAIKSASDSVTIDTVDGDADLRSVQGPVRIDTVAGNLELQAVEGDISASAEGNLRLRLPTVLGDNYTLEAAGNLYAYLPEDAALHLKLVSRGEVIKVRLPDSSKTYQQEEMDLPLGDGTGGVMSLTADGSIFLFIERAWGGGVDEVGLPEDLGRQIAEQMNSQIQSQMEEVSRRLNEQMGRLSEQLGKAGFSPEQTGRIVEDAMRVSERETARAQEKMRRAQEKLERKLEAARRKAETKAQSQDRRTRRSWGFDWFSPPTPPRPPSAPTPPAAPWAPTPPEPPEQVSEEERLMILRMLEQKKISLEEADRLLSALEGKDS
jgi:hypothetical protein